ncbi:hypothetical protein NVS55_31150 [Myxococcus stipitatus]|uniref:hypothetical protein n=1 Tax=Myxococcus stipitatus TaxID=83455 RepID=UPI0031453050
MNSRLLVAFLCLAAVSTGCIVHDNDPYYDDPGDVTFRWTFAGLRCDEDRDIKGVNITIPGERLANDGRYPCQANGFDGIVLHDFEPGTYSFNLVAVSYAGRELYEVSGTFRVGGDVTVDIDLTPIGAAPSFAYLNWLFPNGDSCSRAGVVTVEARVDGGEWARFDCAQGFGGNSIKTPYLEPGEHNLELVGLDSQRRTLYSHVGRFSTRYGEPTSYTATLRSTASFASIQWEFEAGSSAVGCGQAGVASVDARVDGGQWVRFSCSEGRVGVGVTTPSLTPGDHDLQLVAIDGQGRPWYHYTSRFSVRSGETKTVVARMWVIGGASIKWELRSGGSAQSCSQAGISEVAINFRDVFTGEWVYGIVGDRHGCNDAPVVFEFLRPGRYEVEMKARTSTGVEYFSVDDSVYVDIVGHQFPGPQNALLVSMFPR